MRARAAVVAALVVGGLAIGSDGQAPSTAPALLSPTGLALDADGTLYISDGWSERRAIYMEDVACTIYSALGIDWTKRIQTTPSGRAFHTWSRRPQRPSSASSRFTSSLPRSA